MRIAVLTPLPPVRSGIAHYSSMLLPELARHHTVTAIVDQNEFVTPAGCEVARYAEFHRADFDAVICHLGNNPHHQFAYRAAMTHPSVTVLHDLVLHHLIVESTLARGVGESYIQELFLNHGPSGAALARGRTAGFHGEIGNFLYPASKAVADRSLGIVVHNRYAAESLRRLGVRTPITLVGHPYRPAAKKYNGGAVRRELGYNDRHAVIGLFGFVTAAKRPEVIFEAFSAAARSNDNLRLLIVGEPAPNIDLVALASRFGTPKQSWRSLGYVADEDFDRYLTAVDKVVNLRYPSAGETSGALIRVFAAGKPVAVSDYAQFAEYPERIARRIPFGPGEAAALLDFFTTDFDVPAVARAQKEWLQENASLDRAVDGYIRALAGANDFPMSEQLIERSLPVLVNLTAEEVAADRSDDQWNVRITVRNTGPAPLQSGVYGSPGYRLLVKVFDQGVEIFDRWLALPGDLLPGGTSMVQFRLTSASPVLRLEVSHAIEGVPHFDLPAFATAELRG